MPDRDAQTVVISRSSILLVTAMGVGLLTLVYVLGVQVGKQSAALRATRAQSAGEDLKELPSPVAEQLKAFGDLGLEKAQPPAPASEAAPAPAGLSAYPPLGAARRRLGFITSELREQALTLRGKALTLWEQVSSPLRRRARRAARRAAVLAGRTIRHWRERLAAAAAGPQRPAPVQPAPAPRAPRPAPATQPAPAPRAPRPAPATQPAPAPRAPGPAPEAKLAASRKRRGIRLKAEVPGLEEEPPEAGGE